MERRSSMITTKEAFIDAKEVSQVLGVGMTKRPFIYNIVGMWCVRIVGALICTQVLHLGLVAAWACMISHNLFVAFLFFLSYLRGSWNPLLKEGF